MPATALSYSPIKSALAHLRSGGLTEAESACRTSLASASGPSRLPYLRLLAAVVGMTGRDAEAAVALAEAASIDAEGGSRDPDCWNDLGVARERSGDLP